MSVMLNRAADTMRKLYPELPWSMRLSYRGKSQSFGTGEERAHFAFKDEAPLRALSRFNFSCFLDHYVAGDVDFDGDMYAIVGIRDYLRSDLDWVVGWGERIRYALTWLAPSSVRRKLRAVSYHYDLPNEFILSYLDKRTRAYSCAMWKDPKNVAEPFDEELEDAQHAKFLQAARALDIQENDRFLDVGCGYGYMVRLAETEFGCKDTLGITLSKNQVEEGFSNNLRRKHYFELKREPFYDKIYTCGMVSHLDYSEIRRYYECLFSLLKSGGKIWVHGIIPAPDTAASTNYNTVSGTFMQKYVFPDHYQFPISEHLKMMEETGFRVRDVYFRYGHYAKTLRHWYKRYVENLPRTRHLIDRVTERAWHLFLTYASVMDGPKSAVKQIVATKD